ncbi:hypothetical protein CBOM_07396 [Ceraceosorus bombacis]|uniref:Uncharacterized protein n=1 Tax=Ceraceosorus bombacis TaxID=401625 RepID=A0A0P1BAW4_9BASI|nr:hypothetical protein CBOM_07396 [Ceraceosorus bombacis]
MTAALGLGVRVEQSEPNGAASNVLRVRRSRSAKLLTSVWKTWMKTSSLVLGAGKRAKEQHKQKRQRATGRKEAAEQELNFE